MIRGPYLCSHPEHPGLFALLHAKADYRPIGSRFIGGLPPRQEDQADYDFLVTVDYSIVASLAEELEGHGFASARVGGYTEDELIYRFMRLPASDLGDMTFPPVDILIMSPAEAERRLAVFDRLRTGRVSPELAKLPRILKEGRGWPAFWWVTRPESSR